MTLSKVWNVNHISKIPIFGASLEATKKVSVFIFSILIYNHQSFDCMSEPMLPYQKIVEPTTHLFESITPYLNSTFSSIQTHNRCKRDYVWKTCVQNKVVYIFKNFFSFLERKTIVRSLAMFDMFGMKFYRDRYPRKIALLNLLQVFDQIRSDTCPSWTATPPITKCFCFSQFDGSPDSSR